MQTPSIFEDPKIRSLVYKGSPATGGTAGNELNTMQDNVTAMGEEVTTMREKIATMQERITKNEAHINSLHDIVMQINGNLQQSAGLRENETKELRALDQKVGELSKQVGGVILLVQGHSRYATQ